MGRNGGPFHGGSLQGKLVMKDRENGERSATLLHSQRRRSVVRYLAHVWTRIGAPRWQKQMPKSVLYGGISVDRNLRGDHEAGP